jgi:hypothetical protein
MPNSVPSDVTFNPPSCNAGDSVNCTVTLDGTPTADQAVQITADHPSAFTNLPSSITVAANTNSKQFSVQTSSSFGAGSVTVTAACNNGQKQRLLSISNPP